MASEQIENMLIDKINPLLAEHGGQAFLSGYENGIAYITLAGKCSSCLLQVDTFENLIKTAILSNCQDIKDVILDNPSDSEETLDFVRKLLNLR